MDNFDFALNELLKYEGGYQNSPYDVGNYDNNNNLIGTNKGITPSSFFRYYGYYPSVSEMKNLTTQQAGNIYYKDYWIKYGIDKIRNKYVASAILDTLVLFSITTAKTLIDFDSSIIDFNYINSLDPYSFIYDLSNNRINFHYGRVQSNPDQEIFLKGWINRAENILKSFNSNSNNYIYWIVGGSSLAFLLLFLNNDKKKKKRS